MSDLLEIQNQLNRYTCAVNSRDWTELGSVFDVQGSWECKGPPDLKFVGRDAVVTGLRQAITAAKFLTQLNTPSWIKVNGTRATARSTIHEVAEFPDQNYRCEVFGMYEDQLSNIDGQWLCQSRTFTISELRNFKI